MTYVILKERKKIINVEVNECLCLGSEIELDIDIGTGRGIDTT